MLNKQCQLLLRFLNFCRVKTCYRGGKIFPQDCSVGGPGVAQRKWIWLDPWGCRFLRGLRRSRELWGRLQTWLGSCIAVAVVEAGSYSSDSIPSLGTSICLRCSPQKEKKKKKKLFCWGIIRGWRTNLSIPGHFLLHHIALLEECERQTWSCFHS